MIVSRETLLELISAGDVVVEPLDPQHMQPASVDLTLGSHFLKVDENAIDRITLDSELRYLDLHADSEYRAHLVGVMAKRAVRAALAQ